MWPMSANPWPRTHRPEKGHGPALNWLQNGNRAHKEALYPKSVISECGFRTREGSMFDLYKTDGRRSIKPFYSESAFQVASTHGFRKYLAP
ncbi:hypothetical protein DPMN_098290 [Dreissena polymorpha]|uniref:Uncharacterized protein n=1 Tax=Dreissena polymorpha TaxID=45954 RepID=A0A9D4R752_DREPO|nr:hypothetical protein DPMN_098290 [Dreissena polymorpha]